MATQRERSKAARMVRNRAKFAEGVRRKTAINREMARRRKMPSVFEHDACARTARLMCIVAHTRAELLDCGPTELRRKDPGTWRYTKRQLSVLLIRLSELPRIPLPR